LKKYKLEIKEPAIIKSTNSIHDSLKTGLIREKIQAHKTEERSEKFNDFKRRNKVKQESIKNGNCVYLNKNSLPEKIENK